MELRVDGRCVMRCMLVLVLGALAGPGVAAAACPDSPKANGSGYAPPSNTASLPPADAGPEILHRAPAVSPQLENTRNWQAQPILISGAQAYRGGEFVAQDFLYDDRALTYPGDAAYARNAADIVEVRVEPLARATAIRVTLNSMVDVDHAAAITVGLGDSDQPRALPHNAGVSERAEVFVTAHGCGGDAVRASDTAALPAPTVSTDVTRRQVQIELPYTAFDPRGRTVKVSAAAGLWDKNANAYLRPDPARPAFFNVAFRGFGQWTINTWKDESQNAALAAGDLSPLHADVDFAKLAARKDDESGVPTTGPMNRILVSHFETVQGRGNSSGGDILGNYACDPPACTYQDSGRLQPYSVYVPDVAMPKDRWGLVLTMHGANSNHNHFENGSTEPPLSVWRMLAQEGNPSIMVLPNARGMTYCYFGMAGADVFEAWADAAQHYRLDPDQALLSGSSMGGYGVYKLSSQFPDLFKAIFPNIAPEICDLTQAASTLDVVPGATNVGRVLAGLRNVPVVATAGLNDPLVDAAITNRTLGRLDAFGYRYDFWHFLDRSGQGHVEYRQFVRDTYRTLNRSADSVDRNPRRVTYVLDTQFSDARYGLNSDHAYWVSGLKLADAGATPPVGLIDVTAGDIPARRQRLGDPERAVGTGINGSAAYTRQTRRWVPGDPEPISDGFALRAENLSAAALDVRRMRLPEYGSFDGEITSDAPLQLRLTGAFGGATAVTLDGRPLSARADGTSVVVALPEGTSKLHVTQPVPITTTCRRRTVRVRVKAPRGDALRSVRVYVNGRRVKTVTGRTRLRRALRVTLKGSGRAQVTVRATTRKGRALVQRHTYRTCR